MWFLDLLVSLAPWWFQGLIARRPVPRPGLKFRTGGNRGDGEGEDQRSLTSVASVTSCSKNPGPGVPGIFSPYSEKGSPSPPGIQVSFPPGIFCPAPQSVPSRLSPTPVRPDAAQMGKGPGEGVSRSTVLWSTTSVVNYLLEIGDHTTPSLGDNSLMSLASRRSSSASDSGERTDTRSQHRGTPSSLREKNPISIQPQKCNSAKISFFGPTPVTAPALSHGAALGPTPGPPGPPRAGRGTFESPRRASQFRPPCLNRRRHPRSTSGT
jgi:hypothetical protein